MPKKKQKPKQCDLCDRIFADDDEIKIQRVNDSDLCTECVENFPPCVICGERDIMSHEPIEGEYYCSDCYYERFPDVSQFLLEENYIPENFKFLAAKGQYIPDNYEQFYFGFELEVVPDPDFDGFPLSQERGVDLVNDITDQFSWIYCKRESGIQWDGFEIVSHPFTIEWAMEHVQDFENLLGLIAQHDFVSQDRYGCGYHIHISAYPFRGERDSAYTVMAELLHRDWETFAKFSRRGHFQYCRCPDISQDLLEEKNYDFKTTEISSENICHERCAIAHGVENTIEIRLYGGTVDTVSFLAALQLTSNLAEWTRKIVKFNRRIEQKDIDLSKYDFTTILNYRQWAELNDYWRDYMIYPEDQRLVAV
jgi:hypothetical protein